MRILITGSEGFVGREFQRQLLPEGHELYTNDLKPGKTNSKQSHWQGDCRDMFKKFPDIKFDLVIHLAAIVGGRETIENHPLSVADDLSIDAEMFQWALATGQPRIVYYSSSAAYPIASQVRIFSEAYEKDNEVWGLRENDIDLSEIDQPDMTYGWAKLTGEYLASFAEAEGTRVHVFRPFSGYGTDQDLTYPFPSFIERARRGDDPFQIWGDGNQYRDFIHISDVVSGTLEAIRNDIPGPVNLCTGRPTNFTKLADMVTEIAGYHPSFEYLQAKPVGVQFRVGDPTKMNTFYTPKVSLEEGIAKALRGEC